MAEQSTSSIILDTAERMFADRGIAATSLRGIIGEAGVNLAAVHYYFGCKEELIRAVFQRRVAVINKERLRRLDLLIEEHGESPVSVHELLRAFVAPVLEISVDPSSNKYKFIKFMARVHHELEGSLLTTLFAEFKEILERFAIELSRALPHLSQEDIMLRLFFSIGAMAFTMLRYDSVADSPFKILGDGSFEGILNNLVNFSAAGFIDGSPLVKGE